MSQSAWLLNGNNKSLYVERHGLTRWDSKSEVAVFVTAQSGSVIPYIFNQSTMTWVTKITALNVVNSECPYWKSDQSTNLVIFARNHPLQSYVTTLLRRPARPSWDVEPCLLFLFLFLLGVLFILCLVNHSATGVVRSSIASMASMARKVMKTGCGGA